MDLGRRIATLRGRKDLNQSELARILGVTPQAVQHWEKGGGIRQDKFEPLADALGVSLPELFFEESQFARLDAHTVAEVADDVLEGLRDSRKDPWLQLDLTRLDHAEMFIEGYETAMRLNKEGRQSKAARVLEIRKRVTARGAQIDGSGDEASHSGESRGAGSGTTRGKAATSRRGAPKP